MPSDTVKMLLVILAIMHAKGLPGVYTLRSLSYFFRNAGLQKPKLGVLETSKYTSRVWFDDMDLNIHLNNGSYNKTMDFARIALMTRMFPGWPTRNKFDLCLAQTVLFFHSEVPRFTKFTVSTRFIAWDDKWVWMQHRFSIKRTAPRKVKKSKQTTVTATTTGTDLSSQLTKQDSDVDESLDEEEEEEDLDDIDPMDQAPLETSPKIMTATKTPVGNAKESLPDKLCAVGYSRMVAKSAKGRTIKPQKLFEMAGHREAYPGEWEQYRLQGMALVETMMKVDHANVPPEVPKRRLVRPGVAKM